MEARYISSPSNPAVKDAARLGRKRRRYQSRLFLAEGEDLLEAALAGGYTPRQVFVIEGAEGDISAMLKEASGTAGGFKDADLFISPKAVMKKLSALGSGSRVVAVFDFIDRRLDEVIPSGVSTKMAAADDGRWVFLAGVRDPGNAGTLMRSSAALGAAGLIFSTGSADPYSSKAQRAAMGSFFQIPLVLEIKPDELIAWARAAGINIICADASEGIQPWKGGEKSADKPLTRPFVLVLGSERGGVPAEMLDTADMRLRIPQLPGAESLNVAMAGTIILYEALRQRSVTREKS